MQFGTVVSSAVRGTLAISLRNACFLAAVGVFSFPNAGFAQPGPWSTVSAMNTGGVMNTGCCGPGGGGYGARYAPTGGYFTGYNSFYASPMMSGNCSSCGTSSSGYAGSGCANGDCGVMYAGGTLGSGCTGPGCAAGSVPCSVNSAPSGPLAPHPDRQPNGPPRYDRDTPITPPSRLPRDDRNAIPPRNDRGTDMFERREGTDRNRAAPLDDRGTLDRGTTGTGRTNSTRPDRDAGDDAWRDGSGTRTRDDRLNSGTNSETDTFRRDRVPAARTPAEGSGGTTFESPTPRRAAPADDVFPDGANKPVLGDPDTSAAADESRKIEIPEEETPALAPATEPGLPKSKVGKPAEAAPVSDQGGSARAVSKPKPVRAVRGDNLVSRMHVSAERQELVTRPERPSVVQTSIGAVRWSPAVPVDGPVGLAVVRR